MTIPSLSKNGIKEDVHRAACADPSNADVDFFPSKTELNALKRRKMTHRCFDVCAGCPIKAQCAAAAVENEEEYGVWAGILIDPSDVKGSWEKLREVATE